MCQPRYKREKVNLDSSAQYLLRRKVFDLVPEVEGPCQVLNSKYLSLQEFQT